MEKYVLKAEIREKSGKRYSKKLRKDGKIPGIFYSKDAQPVPFVCETSDLKVIRDHESGVILLALGKKKINGLIRNIQYEPVSGRIIHIDVMGIDLKKEVVVEAHIVVKGTPVGVKTYGGILEHITRAIEIKCLPKDIPEQVEIDVSDLNIGHSIHAGDLNIENVKIISKPESVLVTVVPPTVIKEEVVEEEAVEEEEGKEPEVIQKEKEEEEKEEKEEK